MYSMCIVQCCMTVSCAPLHSVIGRHTLYSCTTPHSIQRYTSCLWQATVGKLSMTAAGRRKTDTTRRVAVSAETGVDASDASYTPPVVEKAEDVQAAMMHQRVPVALHQ